MSGLWRVGEHYGIHVYESDRPVATFLTEDDAARCVDAVNGAVASERTLYLNHDRTKPVAGDVARAMDGLDAWTYGQFGWDTPRAWSNPRTGWLGSQLPVERLVLLVDGETGQVVS